MCGGIDDKNKTPSFVVVCILLLRIKHFIELTLRQLVLCRVAAVNHHCADYIFWFFGINKFIYSHFENRALHKPVLGVGAWLVLHISVLGHEETHLNGVCYFLFFGVSLVSKEINDSELILFTHRYKQVLPFLGGSSVLALSWF